MRTLREYQYVKAATTEAIRRCTGGRSLILAILCWLTTALWSVAADAPRYYSIKMNEGLIGYAIVKRVPVEESGKRFSRLESKVVLKYALLGKERRVQSDSQTLVDRETTRPLRYTVTEKTNDLIQIREAQFIAEEVRIWNYQKGKPRGKPNELLMPAETLILGSNNFSHWQLLMDKACEEVLHGKVKLSVFLPETKQIDQFELVQREAQSVLIGKEKRSCVRWEIPSAKLEVLVDATTREFVRLEVPAQQTTVELADASVIKLAEEPEAKDLLERHFIQSNVAFADDRKVRFLVAQLKANVIGSGIRMDVASLDTSMQKFEGKKERDLITGKVTVRSFRVDESKSPPFPTPRTESAMEAWLSPSEYIESDNPAIGALATTLTRESNTRWEAVRKIGDWVYKEIAYTIADTPSAELALEKREGDCGPHSTLMVAMLRALEIPARLVGGLVFTQALGGSFGQHAWVEVHMGEMGWVAVDPTTGEVEEINATHIKLFEGLGGVLPTAIHVIEFKPENPMMGRETSPSQVNRQMAKPFAWQLGRPYKFSYRQGDKEFGSETFTVDEVPHDGLKVFQIQSKTRLKINFLASFNSDTTLLVAKNATPISFMQHLSAFVQKIKIECTFGGGSVNQRITGTTDLNREFNVPGEIYCFDNNLMSSWVMICSQLELKLGAVEKINTFHPSSMQTIALTFTPKKISSVEISGNQIDCFECEVLPIKNTFWISLDGRFLRCQQGDLVIEVVDNDLQ
ncbi:MAG: transglutaminase-like domain-containing protein [Rubripirellula sp.]|nr:transglutaminase-like domain-containing protein [Rubripirellula sp.]